jgi:hypothetical protein
MSMLSIHLDYEGYPKPNLADDASFWGLSETVFGVVPHTFGEDIACSSFHRQ